VIDLDAIARRRGEEQQDLDYVRRRFFHLPNQNQPTCVCGTCRVCRAREKNRRLRARRRVEPTPEPTDPLDPYPMPEDPEG
jgi:hypothetical protein